MRIVITSEDHEVVVFNLQAEDLYEKKILQTLYDTKSECVRGASQDVRQNTTLELTLALKKN